MLKKTQGLFWIFFQERIIFRRVTEFGIPYQQGENLNTNSLFLSGAKVLAFKDFGSNHQ